MKWKYLGALGWVVALASWIHIWDLHARHPWRQPVTVSHPDSAEVDLRRRLDDELATLERLRQALVLPDDDEDDRDRNRNQRLARATRDDLERRQKAVGRNLRAALAELDQSRREHGYDFRAELELRENEIAGLKREREQIDRHLRRLEAPTPPRPVATETNEHRALKEQEARVDALRLELEKVLNEK